MKLSSRHDYAEATDIFWTDLEDVRIRQLDGIRTAAFEKVRDEWKGVNALWRKERQDCGCTQCLGEL